MEKQLRYAPDFVIQNRTILQLIYYKDFITLRTLNLGYAKAFLYVHQEETEQVRHNKCGYS